MNLFKTARRKILFKRDMTYKYQCFNMKKNQHDSLFILHMNYMSIYNFVIIWIKRYLLLPRKYRIFLLCLLLSKVNQRTVWTYIYMCMYVCMYIVVSLLLAMSISIQLNNSFLKTYNLEGNTHFIWAFPGLFIIKPIQKDVFL